MAFAFCAVSSPSADKTRLAASDSILIGGSHARQIHKLLAKPHTCALMASCQPSGISWHANVG